MHEALHLNRLQLLPISTRIIILAACKSTASKDTVDRALEKVFKAEEEATPSGASAVDSHLSRYLPFFFAVLDPSRTPSAAAMETWTSETLTAVYSAVTALDLVLPITQLPAAIALDRWPCISAWLSFIYLYGTQVWTLMESSPPRDRPVGPIRLWTNLALYLLHLSIEHPPATEILRSTPGFAIFVMQTWVHLRYSDQLSMQQRQIVFATLLHKTKFAVATDSEPRLGRQHLEEALEGAGGTYGDIAFLIVDFLDAAMASGSPELERTRSDKNTVDLVRIMLTVTTNLDFSSLPNVTVMDDIPFQMYGGHLTSALRELEAVYPALLKAINHLCALPERLRTHENAVEAFELCATQLNRLVKHDAHLATAIQAGLLGTLAHMYSASGLDEKFEMIFTLLLKPALMSPQLLAVCSQALEQLPVTGLSENAEWVAFVQKVAERMNFLTRLDDPNESSMELTAWRMRACDNFECNKIQERSAFRRCACGSVYYCSRTCQTADWHVINGHRSACATRWRFLLSDFMTPRLPFKQRCFLRQLIHAEYLQNFDEICRLQ
ncbi:hypothetical protein C8F01DRAFT_1239358, partial [Mycena amicta]